MIPVSEFKGKYIIQGLIACKTGLHIGGSKEGIEIGGEDNPVIKNPLTGMPYIPGSAFKGKIRSMLEWSLGLIAEHPDHQNSFAAYDCRELEYERGHFTDPTRWDKASILGRLCGAASNKDSVRIQAGPTRLTVRDAFLTETAQKDLQDSLGLGTFTEIKTENALDRVTSAANPRPIERVPAGAEFRFTLIVDIYDEADRDLLRDLFGALALVEDGTLGGGGSRGHGQIEFSNLEVAWRPLAYYLQGQGEKPIAAAKDKRVRDIAARFNVQEWV